MNISVMLPLTLLLFTCCTGRSQNRDNYVNQRELMVKTQIEARGINNPAVLKAMRKVERHLFVPQKYMAQAYNDHPLPIGYEQTISQPYIVAFMTEALDIRPGMKILEIGTGSGYQAAVLAEMTDSVYTIEIVPALGHRAQELLSELGYDNVHVRIGDGYQGWPEHALFDAIIVTCSPTHVPQPLVDQLQENGKMIIPVGEQYSQNLIVLEKKKGKLIQRVVLPVRFVPMVNEQQQEY